MTKHAITTPSTTSSRCRAADACRRAIPRRAASTTPHPAATSAHPFNRATVTTATRSVLVPVTDQVNAMTELTSGG
jgi:hypothetical protein